MSEPFVVTFEKKSYTWDNGRWYGTTDYTKPTLGMIHKLNALLPAASVAKTRRLLVGESDSGAVEAEWLLPANSA